MGAFAGLTSDDPVAKETVVLIHRDNFHVLKETA